MSNRILLRSRVTVVLLIWVLLISSGVRLWACSCIEQTTCDPHFYGDSDFTGQVLSEARVPPGDQITWWHLSVRIRVIESFRGVRKAGEIVNVQTGMGGGDCGYHFEVGKRYLVDAWERGGTLSTGICSRTATVDRGEVDIRILRRIAAHQRLPELAGELSQISGTEGELGNPLAGVPVSLRREGGGPQSTVISDSLGFFEFNGVPEGRYRLSLDLPNNLSAAYSNLGKIENAKIPPIVIKTVSGTVCRAEIIVGQATGISGVVRFPDGKWAEGWVKVDTITTDGRPWNTVLTSELAPSGSFQLEHLKPGRYQVQFTRKQGFIQGNPQIVDLREGERKTGIVLLAK